MKTKTGKDVVVPQRYRLQRPDRAVPQPYLEEILKETGGIKRVTEHTVYWHHVSNPLANAGGYPGPRYSIGEVIWHASILSDCVVTRWPQSRYRHVWSFDDSELPDTQREQCHPRLAYECKDWLVHHLVRLGFMSDTKDSVGQRSAYLYTGDNLTWDFTFEKRGNKVRVEALCEGLKTTVEHCASAVVTILGTPCLMPLLPRDLRCMIAAMVWETRTHVTWVGEPEAKREIDRITTKRQRCSKDASAQIE
jgi:hypothetical protein